MESLFEFSPLLVAIVPVIIGLVQVAKTVGLPSNYAPFASIVFGMVLVALTGLTWQGIVIQGIIAGLAASGLFSGTKTTIQG